MKKGRSLFLILAFCILALAGCSRQEEENEDEYTIYYVNTEETKLVESPYVPVSETFDGIMEELQQQLQEPPAGVSSALTGDVEIQGYQRGIDALRVNFSEEYYDLTNTEEVLLRAAAVKTFVQVPGVIKVMITVEGEQLVDLDGQPVPAMDGDTFIDTKEGGINSYQDASLSLYFAQEDGQELKREMRSIHYSSNMILSRVVVEQLIAGPEERGLARVLTEDTVIENIHIQDGVCTVYFSEAANQTPAESQVSPETALYAIVNSICDTCNDILGVRIVIDNGAVNTFRDEIDLDQTFNMNRAIIQGSGSSEMEAESAGETIQNSEEETQETVGNTQGIQEIETQETAGNTQGIQETEVQETAGNIQGVQETEHQEINGNIQEVQETGAPS